MTLICEDCRKDFEHYIRQQRGKKRFCDKCLVKRRRDKKINNNA